MFRSTPVSSKLSFGAIVTGLDMTDLDDAETVEALRNLWIDKGVLVFRDVIPESRKDLIEAFQIKLSLCFGDLEEHPLKTFEASNPALAVAKFTPDYGHICDIDGVKRGGWLPWHSDLMYVAKINRGGILAPVQMPRSGGQTGFIDQISAYERVPLHLREKIENLYVVYKLDLDVGNQKFGKTGKTGNASLYRVGEQFGKIMARVDDYPEVLHPMVFTQVETGKKVLNVSPWFALGIEGMRNEEGDRLLSEIVDICIDPANAYFHEWRPTDLVLWDNWRMLHCAVGVDPTDTRIMKRTTIKGDYALGKLASGADAAVGVDMAAPVM